LPHSPKGPCWPRAINQAQTKPQATRFSFVSRIDFDGITVELTRRRESKHLRPTMLVARGAPAARVQRFVGPRSVSKRSMIARRQSAYDTRDFCRNSHPVKFVEVPNRPQDQRSLCSLLKLFVVMNGEDDLGQI